MNEFKIPNGGLLESFPLCPICGSLGIYRRRVDYYTDETCIEVMIHAVKWTIKVSNMSLQRDGSNPIVAAFLNHDIWKHYTNPSLNRALWEKISKDKKDHGAFVKQFASAVVASGDEDYRIIHLVAHRLMCKYDLVAIAFANEM